MSRIAIAIVAVVLAAGIAHADPPPEEQAKAHFMVGKGYRELGEYRKAAEEFKAAYAIDPRPEMLFNIAQAYRLAGDKQEALDYFEKYLAAQPDGSGAVEAREHVTALKQQIADDAAHSTATPAPPIVAIVPPKPPVDRGDVDGSPGLRITGLVAAGLGVVGIGLGIKFGLDARAASNAITANTMPWQIADHERFDAGERANRNMYISVIAGSALVVTGGVLYVLGRRTHVAPTVGARATGLAMWGTW
jgi:tetratricopeptide (TPR) repeat protein